ncbi:hypothetical protein [Leptothoe sp. PORK10 BA2]|uniref:hypothetical protein n=1 Tax=Leptothoe sp. PORK10 BA2 TaxID=3110254 RepID=UPI002B219F7D|nr:hypothetical protein [Leptothoe sp. PORK10 BA2]MEA5464912.1 hypothetical protein [Leptothoe sp. PORK10 BA2]
MKIYELKKRVERLWTSLHSWKGELTSPPDEFGMDIKKQFGDRRYKKTWILALARYEAQKSYDTLLDSSLLITHYLNFKPTQPLYEYRFEILDAFLEYKNGLDLILQGIRTLFRDGCAHEEKESIDALLGLLETRKALPGAFEFGQLAAA